MFVHLPIADMDVSAAGLLLLGLVIGTLSGFFGVGGGFLLTPLLAAVFGIPMPVAVGSSLAQIAGTGVSGVIRHRGLGNVDYRLGTIVAGAAVLGLGPGVALIDLLKRGGEVTVLGAPIPLADLVVSLSYIPLLVGIALWMWSETKNTTRGVGREDGHHWALARWARRWTLGPHVSLPASGVKRISLWVPVVGGVGVGFLSAFLGVGGGLLLLPMLVYVLGVRTTTAVATDLFQVVLVAGMGTVLHGLNGNIDAVLVIWVLVGGIIGAQVGATFTRYASGPRIRRYFSYLTLIAAALVALRLALRLRG
jgi:uncharacterized membrane protein YfcA